MTRESALPVVDEARGRALPTQLDVPAVAAPWPLVVFAHGWMGHPRRFRRLFDRWTAAGYAVAAPTFPNTNEASSGQEMDDVQHQAADVRLVLDSLLADDRFDPARVAVAGFSLGAQTALDVAFETKKRDARLAAAVAISGALSPFCSRYEFGPLPLLVVHGTSDPVVEYAHGSDVYRRAQRPKALLTVLTGGHDIAQDEPATAADATVAEVTTAFLDVALRGVTVPRPRVDPTVARLESEGIW
ncbi:MAG: alpha/beta fold hydrolase [Thermoleophilia bacterium]|nr:alpha/beta fold hydrolase [Thermoleophilia bacterium]